MVFPSVSSGLRNDDDPHDLFSCSYICEIGMRSVENYEKFGSDSQTFEGPADDFSNRIMNQTVTGSEVAAVHIRYRRPTGL